jgi:hypothetical protein
LELWGGSVSGSLDFMNRRKQALVHDAAYAAMGSVLHSALQKQTRISASLNVRSDGRSILRSHPQRTSASRPLCRATVPAHGGPSSDIAMPRRGQSRQPLVSSAEELILGLCQQLVIDPPISTTGGPTMLKLSIHGRFRFAQEYVYHMAILRFVGGFLTSLFTAQSCCSLRTVPMAALQMQRAKTYLWFILLAITSAAARSGSSAICA